MHDQQPWFMVRLIGMHGTNDTKVIGMAGKIREEFAHHYATLAMFGELEWTGHQAGSLLLTKSFAVWHFALMFGQQRFGVEGVHMGGTAVHEEKDHTFGPRCDMGKKAGSVGRLQGSSKSKSSKSGSHLTQGLAAGNWEM